jgi:1-acyl-sn-glycerol-3-phosphate acyltransferase
MKWTDFLSPRLLVHVLLLRPILRLLFGFNVRGRENLDGLDRFIVVANHNSHLDTLLLYAALPVRQIRRTHAVAARDYFARFGGLFRAVEFLFRPVWVDRDRSGGGTVARIQEVLDGGGNVILFPEGTRGEPGEMQTFRSGIGRIAEANRSIPVVPVFLEGPERAFPRSALFPVPLWNHAMIAPPQWHRERSERVTMSLQRTLEDLGEPARRTRHARPGVPGAPFRVAVLGIDGSGKSTLSRRLARECSGQTRSCVISDSVQVWERGRPQPLQPLVAEKLRSWIGARAKRADSLARYKIPKLAEIFLRDRLLDEVGRWYRPEWAFMDGMPVLNLCAWSALYRDGRLSEEACAKILSVLTRREPRVEREDPVFAQYPELGALRRLRLDRMHLPDVCVFLDVPPEVCVTRIESRGERRQVHETREKLARLREAYLLVCSVLEHEFESPVLVLEGDRDPDQVMGEAMQFVEQSRRAAA